MIIALITHMNVSLNTVIHLYIILCELKCILYLLCLDIG